MLWSIFILTVVSVGSKSKFPGEGWYSNDLGGASSQLYRRDCRENSASLDRKEGRVYSPLASFLMDTQSLEY